MMMESRSQFRNQSWKPRLIGTIVVAAAAVVVATAAALRPSFR
jgi:hypothetical protein